jgi:salicylate hydroxylase
MMLEAMPSEPAFLMRIMSSYGLRRAQSGKSGAFIFLDESARELHRFVFETAQAELHCRITGQVDRQTLREALISGIETKIAWGVHFSHYELLQTGVKVFFRDGSSTVADLLVGADGGNSLVRGQLLPNLVPVDTGHEAIFGRTTIAQDRLPIVDGLVSQGGVMCLGPKGRIFFCTSQGLCDVGCRDSLNGCRRRG